jgi:hypothetical protein
MKDLAMPVVTGEQNIRHPPATKLWGPGVVRIFQQTRSMRVICRPVRIAQLSCGPEYSGVQKEINDAAAAVGAEIFYPEMALKDLQRDYPGFGLDIRSPDLKLAIARAKALVDGRIDADAVFIATCFRCAEAAIVPMPHPIKGQGLYAYVTLKKGVSLMSGSIPMREGGIIRRKRGLR